MGLIGKVFSGAADRIGRIGRALWGTDPLPLPQPFKEQGASGTAVWGGYVQVKDQSAKWIGRQKYRTATELAVNTSVVSAGIHYFANLIANAKWTAKSAEPGNPEADEMAKFMATVLEDTVIPWPNIVRQASMYRFHGFSIQEWIACKRWDGAIGLESIEIRPQHTIEQWAVDEFGKVIGCYQRSPQTNQLLGLPRGKLVYLVEDTLTDSPEGLGVFRHLAEPYARLMRYQALEARAYERDLRGIPVARAPLAAINAAVKAGQITEAQSQQMLAGIQAMIQLQVKQSDTGILMDSQPYFSTTQGGPAVSEVMQWTFELLNGPGLGLVEIAAAIERIQREMARVMGIEHLLLGDGGGSRAVAQDKSRNVYLIASSVLKNIVAAMQRDIVDPIWDLNALPPQYKPKLTAEDIAPKDVVEISTTLARMSQSGATLSPDDPVINDVRDLLGVSRAKPITGMEGEEGLMSDEPQPSDELLPLLNPDGSIVPPEQDPRQNGLLGERGMQAGDAPVRNLDRELPRGAARRGPRTDPELQRLPRSTASGATPLNAVKRWPFYTKGGAPMYLNGDARPQ